MKEHTCLEEVCRTCGRIESELQKWDKLSPEEKAKVLEEARTRRDYHYAESRL